MRIVLVSHHLEVEGKIVAAVLFRRLSNLVVPGWRCSTIKWGAGEDIENISQGAQIKLIPYEPSRESATGVGT